MRVFWRPLAQWYEGGPAGAGERVEVLATSSPSTRNSELGRMRRTLADRAWSHAGDWLQTRRTMWALAAEVEADPPRTFTAPGAEGAASGPWGDLPAPLERTGLLFVEPGDGA